MTNLVVYGSLMHEDELFNQGLSGHNLEQIKVYGYKRVFNQEPSYRQSDSINRAVLNIVASPNDWFNAILIKDLDEAYLEALDIREQGYDRVIVDVITYNKKSYKNCFVYLGRKSKQNNEIKPNLEYQTLCEEGAKTYGEEFYEDYLETTFGFWLFYIRFFKAIYLS